MDQKLSGYHTFRKAMTSRSRWMSRVITLIHAVLMHLCTYIYICVQSGDYYRTTASHHEIMNKKYGRERALSASFSATLAGGGGKYIRILRRTKFRVCSSTSSSSLPGAPLSGSVFAVSPPSLPCSYPSSRLSHALCQ